MSVAFFTNMLVNCTHSTWIIVHHMMIDNYSLIANQNWNSAISTSFKMHAWTFPSFVWHHFIWFLCAQFGRNPSLTSTCGQNSSFSFSYGANEMECNSREKIVVKCKMIRLQESQTKKYPMIQSCIYHYKLRPCLLHNMHEHWPKPSF